MTKEQTDLEKMETLMWKRDHPRRSLQTIDAARYLGISASLLRKMRLRAPDDPLGPGPKYIKLSSQLVIYDIHELDRWLDSHKGK